MEFQSLIGEHREIEGELDCLAEGIATGAINIDTLRRVHRLCILHYEREEPFLVRLGERDAPLATKLRGQHCEAMEVADRLHEAVDADQTCDAIYLARRFLAITQHNMIEEERDVFPFVANL
jgi:hypothetical protein